MRKQTLTSCRPYNLSLILTWTFSLIQVSCPGPYWCQPYSVHTGDVGASIHSHSLERGQGTLTFFLSSLRVPRPRMLALGDKERTYFCLIPSFSFCSPNLCSCGRESRGVCRCRGTISFPRFGRQPRRNHPPPLCYFHVAESL